MISFAFESSKLMYIYYHFKYTYIQSLKSACIYAIKNKK